MREGVVVTLIGADAEAFEAGRGSAAAAGLTLISDRQFGQQLAIDGVITEAEALTWAARGDLPVALEAVMSQLGEQALAAHMLLSAATTYKRGHPLTTVLGALLGCESADLDRVWRDAAAH